MKVLRALHARIEPAEGGGFYVGTDMRYEGGASAARDYSARSFLECMRSIINIIRESDADDTVRDFRVEFSAPAEKGDGDVVQN